MWTIVVLAILLIAGVIRTLTKGQFTSLGDFFITLFFIDFISDHWNDTSEVTEATGSSDTTTENGNDWETSSDSDNGGNDSDSDSD